MIIDSPIISGSLIVTGSAAFTGSLTLSGSMTTIGTITATTLVVQTVTSSISRITGSTSFGSSSINNHNFTGSLIVSGGMSVNSTAVNIGNEISNPTLILRTGGSTTYSGNILTNSNVDSITINGGAGANYDSGSGISFMGADRYGTKTAGVLTLYAGNAVNNTGFGCITMNTANTERLRITYGGLIGINTIAPSYPLDVQVSGSTFTTRIKNNNTTTDSAGLLVQAGVNASNEIALFKNAAGTDVMGIYAGGKVMIGNTTGDGRLYIKTASAVSFSPTVYTGTSANIRLETGGTPAQNITTGISFGIGGAAEAYIGAVQNSSTYADIVFQSYNGSYGERMRLTSAGFLGIGTNNPSRALQVDSSAGAGTFLVHNGRNTNGDNIFILQLGGSGTNNTTSYYMYCDTDNVGVRMVVYGNGNVANVNGSYGTYSDISLKENIVDATPKLNDLLQLKVRNFNLKADENKTKQIGFIAQELEEIFPSMIEIDGESNMKTIKTSILVPMLVKAIQELNTKFEEYKATHP